ncbi:DNA helicase UvrD [Candidatus Peregrinibacteria bacterium]|nr:DNA helicase UvrD [Candidatus Peregrinibacteria bacterium]
MIFTADFHIHSHYSRATSKFMDANNLYKWGQLKGIRIIGTGDFTHPKWFSELREKLEPAESGLFRLKKAYAKEIEHEIPESCRSDFRFMLTVEISNIYSKNGRVRKVHNVICAPSFEIASKINSELSKIGNLQADGRPILGLDSKRLFQITLDASTDCMFIPAHIWTPYFAVFGSKSGFDSLEECFEDLTPFITALETGLSSDPPMNRTLSALDDFTLVSNSDAHSPQKLGREVNRFDTELSYFSIRDAVKNGDPKHFLETVEFFPEEGKYHYDGHSTCEVRFSPEETKKHNGLCPKCGHPLTIGVLNRVASLADRSEPGKKSIPYRYLIPLPEILSDIYSKGVSSKYVNGLYFSMLEKLGNEFSILLDIPLETIEKASSSYVARAIQKVREGKVRIAPGYDGEFGTIEVFTEKEKSDLQTQKTLFSFF